MSDFAGLRIALNALYAQRRGMELTGQNVSNANTEGYSRQRVELQSIGAGTAQGVYSRSAMGAGNGVRVADIIRYRDQFLEIRAALEHGAEAHLGRVRVALESLEQIFGEPSDLGLGKQLSEMWAGWDDVANLPGDSAGRTLLLDRAATVASTFNESSREITRLDESARSAMSTIIAEVNTTAALVAGLNRDIKSAVIAELHPNELMDQRDLLVGKLASLIGATVRPGEYGAVNVAIGGTSLVFEERAESLGFDPGGVPASIVWVSSGGTAAVSSGEAGGLLEVINQTLPGYRADLDAVAVNLRDTVNALHAAITGSIAATDRDQSAAGALDFEMSLNGAAFATVTVAGADWSGAGGAAALSASLQAAVDAAIGAGNTTVTVTGAAGQPLEVTIVPTGTNALRVRASGTNVGFATLLGTTAVGKDGIGGRDFFSGTGAGDLALSALVSGIPDAVAAGTAAGGPLDGSQALLLGDLATAQGGPDALYRSYIVGLGVDAQTTARRHDIQKVAMQQVDGSRDAYSSVNIDEEMVNMVQFQHAYDAAARFMTAIDEMLDTLINQTGHVGR